MSTVQAIAVPAASASAPYLRAPCAQAAGGVLSRRRRGFLTCLFAVSGILIVKPPPYDLILLVAILSALLGRKMLIRNSFSFALSMGTLYVTATVASSFMAPTVWEALWYDGLTAFCLLLWWYFADLFDRFGGACVTAVMNGYVITSCIGIAFGLAVMNTNLSAKQEFLYYSRPTGLYVDANIFGSSLVPPMLYCLSRALGESAGRRRLAWAAGFIAMSIGVVSTLSRGAVINAGVSLLLFAAIVAVKLPSARRGVVMVVLAGTALCGAVAFLSANSDLGASAATRLQLQSYDTQRWQVHEAALDVALAHPFLGVGPGQFQNVASPLQVLYRGRYVALATHNTYLHVFAESGFMALTPMLLFLGAVLCRAKRAVSRAILQADVLAAAWVCGCLAGILVSAWVIDSYHWRHLWLLCAIPWVSSSPPRERYVIVYAARQS